MELEPFMLGLILVGVGLTVKVARDGLMDIGDIKVRIADCNHQIAETEIKTIDLEEQACGKDLEVNALRKEVAEVEDKEKQLSFTLRKKKQGEKEAAKTKFKVEMGNKQG